VGAAVTDAVRDTDMEREALLGPDLDAVALAADDLLGEALGVKDAFEVRDAEAAAALTPRTSSAAAASRSRAAAASPGPRWGRLLGAGHAPLHRRIGTPHTATGDSMDLENNAVQRARKGGGRGSHWGTRANHKMWTETATTRLRNRRLGKKKKNPFPQAFPQHVTTGDELRRHPSPLEASITKWRWDS
jgi:hypothetical protein